MKRRSQDSGECGFTLVELLVCLVLMGMLGSVAMLGYRTIVPAWRQVEARTGTGVRFQDSVVLLDSLVSQAYPALIGDSGTARRIDFTGTSARLEFLAPLVQRFGASVIARYIVHLGDDGTLRIMPQLDFAAADQDADKGLPEAVLLDNLSDLTFAYFGAERPSATPSWQASWVDRQSLPLLVRIRLTPRQRWLPNWPDIIVAAHVTADADCTFDPADGKCRGQ